MFPAGCVRKVSGPSLDLCLRQQLDEVIQHLQVKGLNWGHLMLQSDVQGQPGQLYFGGLNLRTQMSLMTL